MSSIGYVNIGLSAAADESQVGALQLVNNAYMSQITTCTGTENSCLLPVNPPYGFLCKIRNDSTAELPLYVYPQIGGQINTLPANIPYVLSVECLAEFVAISGLDWLVSSSSYSAGLNVANKYVNVFPVLDQAGVAFNIQSAYSGGLFQLAAQTDALVVNVPSPVNNAGLYYTFQLVGDTAGHNITITPAAGEFNGSLINNIPGGVTCLSCTGKADIEILAAATIGTTLTIMSDGTNYIANGFGTLDDDDSWG